MEDIYIYIFVTKSKADKAAHFVYTIIVVYYHDVFWLVWVLS